MLNCEKSSKNILCLIIISNSEKKQPKILFDSILRSDLIKKINSDESLKQIVQLTHIYSDVQTEFIDRIVKNSKLKTTDSNKSTLENKVLKNDLKKSSKQKSFKF